MSGDVAVFVTGQGEGFVDGLNGNTKHIVFEGEIVYDKSKPNGTPRKMMDATHIKELGWQPKIELEQGIKDFYDWYLSLDK